MGGNTRTKSRTHNTPLGGDSAVGLSIGFNLGSSQITLLVWLLSLPACWRLMAWHQCRSVKPQSLVKGSPQRWERLGSNGLGNNMAAQSFFSSIFRYYLAQLSTFSLSKQNLSSFFFSPWHSFSIFSCNFISVFSVSFADSSYSKHWSFPGFSPRFSAFHFPFFHV